MSPSTNSIHCRLTAKDQGCEGQSSRGVGSQFQSEMTGGQDAGAEGQLADAHGDARRL